MGEGGAGWGSAAGGALALVAGGTRLTKSAGALGLASLLLLLLALGVAGCAAKPLVVSPVPSGPCSCVPGRTPPGCSKC